MQRFKSGFTLIELLVVIAIIGILSSVVLASLSSSRTKSSTAAIRTSLAQLRTQANIYVNDNGNFGPAFSPATCPASGTTIFMDAKIQAILSKINSETGSFNASCASSATGVGSWAVWTQIKTDGTTNYLCTDATGLIKSYASAPTITTAAVCP